MQNIDTRATTSAPLRLWPGIALALVVIVARYLLTAVAPDAEIVAVPLALIGVLAGVAGGIAIALWWLFFSRARWSERIGAIALAAGALLVTSRLVHPSIAGGQMGMMLPLYAVPVLAIALVAWAVATRRMSDTTRRATLVAAIVLACVPFTLLRTAGVRGAGSELHWRWTPTPEERLLAQADAEVLTPPSAAIAPVTAPDASSGAKPPAAAPAALAAGTTPAPTANPAAPPANPPSSAGSVRAGEAPAETPASSAAVREGAANDPESARVIWPGFRGADRNSVVRGVQIDADWSASPPSQLWRRPVGPGWSSFAVRGDLLYTQEQRGDDEIVAAYRMSTGEPVWRHRDAARFWESNGGAGPRGTPTVHDGRVYAFGATGILNALDAATGATAWSRDVAADSGRRVPDWGFASSPLIEGDLVIVAAAGTLVAYDIATGQPRWKGPSYGGSYSSPHRVTLDGVSQIVLLGGPGAVSVAAETGAVLWEYKWAAGTIVQPAMTPDGDLLISGLAATGGLGTRRLAVNRGPAGWTLAERWTSNGLKPYFNDFVVHEGYAYGFDGNILSCIDLADGTRKWKGGRYGNGQMVLLADQDLLLVVSEEGEIALVNASPDRFTQVARFAGLEGKTWNHPVLVGDVLLVRNGEEMAAFRLNTRGSTAR